MHCHLLGVMIGTDITQVYGQNKSIKSRADFIRIWKVGGAMAGMSSSNVLYFSACVERNHKCRPSNIT
jgi:hypothetical protein